MVSKILVWPKGWLLGEAWADREGDELITTVQVFSAPGVDFLGPPPDIIPLPRPY